MTKAFRLLGEPYVHVIIIALVLVRLASGTGGEAPRGRGTVAVVQPAGEDPLWQEADHVSARLNAMFPAE